MNLPPALLQTHQDRLRSLGNVKYAAAHQALQSFDPTVEAQTRDAAVKLMPWKKGPFKFGPLEIDGEWDCQQKWQRLAPHLGNLSEKLVLDLGCNNGWYMHQLSQHGAREVVGFDPMPLNWLQWSFTQKLQPHTNEEFYLLGVEDLPSLPSTFDVILSFGVLYHHRSPIQQLLDLRESLVPGGTLFLETIGVSGQGTELFIPSDRYANMPNVWFLPTLNGLKTMLERTRFTEIEVLSTEWGGEAEQRSTQWTTGPSYRDILDPHDPSKTMEGHAAPLRFMLKAKRKKGQ